MDQGRADAARQRITEQHRRQRRAELAGLKGELLQTVRTLYGVVDRLDAVARRLQYQDDMQAQEETTVALPILSNKKPPTEGPGASS